MEFIEPNELSASKHYFSVQFWVNETHIPVKPTQIIGFNNNNCALIYFCHFPYFCLFVSFFGVQRPKRILKRVSCKSDLIDLRFWKKM